MNSYQAPVGNAAAGLTNLLANLGISTVAARDTVEDHVTRALAARGLTADVASVRYRTLTLVTDPQTAALLRYDTTNLLTELNTHLDEPLRNVRVKVQRP